MSAQSKKQTTTKTVQNRSQKTVQSAGRKSSKAAAAPPPPARRSLLSVRAKNDLTGLIIAIIAIVLLVMVFLPSNAVGARFISEGLRLICGQGAVLLPFMLLAWAFTFFIKRRFTNSSPRVALGLAVIFLALIAVFAALIPGAMQEPGRVFESLLLMNGGGYVGGAIAWALLSLVGPAATIIVLIGLMLVGLVLVGLSITGLVEWFINAVKSKGAQTSEIPLSGAMKQSQQEGGAAATGTSSQGSAYQMGMPMPGAYAQEVSSAAGRRGAFPQPTDVMTAGQLEDTLYRPSRGRAEENTDASFAELGSTRRRIARHGWNDEIDAQAPTRLFSDDASAEGGDAAASAAGNKAGEEDAPQSDLPATAVLGGASQKRKGRKAGGKGASNQVSSSLDAVYTLPSMKLLRVSSDKAHTKAGASELRATANRLQGTLEEFRVEGEVVGWIAGPTVTLYKISLGEGVRLNRVTALQSDIQLALAAQAIRIVAPIPGTSLVGIEIPNAARNQVLLGDVLDSARESTLALAIGKDVEGESIVADLASMPHLLIGGTTGSGKSVAINSIIMSLLMRTTPDEVRMIMIDPKRVELTLYNGIPHLYVPVVTDAGQAASALAWCVAEMDRRLKIFEKHAVKNIRQFNTRVTAHLEQLEKERAQAGQVSRPPEEERAADETACTSGVDESALDAADYRDDLDAADEVDVTVEQENLRATLPYLVIVIDELADLMMLNGKEVESAISRLAQLARAAGLHLIVATQRPSTNVITGLIKANIVNRIAFTVASGIDSRVILDTPGAEDLIGLGDMLFSRPEYSKPVRIQGCLVSEPEIETVVEFWRGLGETDYHEEILLAAPGNGASSGTMGGDSLEDDPLLWEAAEIVVSSQLGSTSTLQRRLKVGYARAGRIMDMLEMKGVVGPPNGSKPREVLVDDVLDLETLRAYG